MSSKFFFSWFCFEKLTHHVRTKLNLNMVEKIKTSTKGTQNPNFNYHKQHKGKTFKKKTLMIKITTINKQIYSTIPIKHKIISKFPN